MNGYGDQSQVLGRDGGNSTDYSFDVASNHTHNGDNAPQDVTASTTANIRKEEQESADSSQHPDLSVIARQRIGTDYYEQDDTTYKILFDSTRHLPRLHRDPMGQLFQSL
ncbi:hypothetical protein V8C42DRAFT_338767 [Trichoderma barbatum]